MPHTPPQGPNLSSVCPATKGTPPFRELGIRGKVHKKEVGITPINVRRAAIPRADRSYSLPHSLAYRTDCRPSTLGPTNMVGLSTILLSSLGVPPRNSSTHREVGLASTYPRPWPQNRGEVEHDSSLISGCYTMGLLGPPRAQVDRAHLK